MYMYLPVTYLTAPLATLVIVAAAAAAQIHPPPPKKSLHTFTSAGQPNATAYCLSHLTPLFHLTLHLHLGLPIVSLTSRPFASVISALALPTFTTSLAGPHLNLPQSSSLPSSSTVAPTVTTSATIMPIPSTSSTPVAQQLPPYISNKIPTLPKKLTDSILAWEYIDLSDLLPEQLRINTPGTFASGKEVVVVPKPILVSCLPG